MKLVFFDDFKLGAVKGDNVVDLSGAAEHIPHVSPQDILSGLIADFDTHKSHLEEAIAASDGVPLSSVRLRSPAPGPLNIICMAVNYMENGTRSEPRADKRLQQVAERGDRRRRYHPAAGCGFVDIRA